MKYSFLLAQVEPINQQQAQFLGLSAQGTLLDRILLIVNIVLALLGVAAAIFLVIAGIRYMTSQGEEGEVKKAKNAIIYTVIGLVVIGLSAIIVNTVLRVF